MTDDAESEIMKIRKSRRSGRSRSSTPPAYVPLGVPAFPRLLRRVPRPGFEVEGSATMSESRKKPRMTMAEAAFRILSRKGCPLHYKEITRIALRYKMIESRGKTPEQSMRSTMATEYKKKGRKSRFKPTGDGYYTLTAHGRRLASSAGRGRSGSGTAGSTSRRGGSGSTGKKKSPGSGKKRASGGRNTRKRRRR